MHILAIVALVALVGLVLLIQWVLTAIGVIKPPPIVPSGIAIGEQATCTLRRGTPAADRHQDALDKMITLADYNGEVWRVLDCKPDIDNTYTFTLKRVG